MDKTGESSVGSLAVKGASALLWRQIFIHGLNFISGILLSRFLLPQDFGIYAVISFVILFLFSIIDLGISYRLIQQPETPALKEYQSVFTFQLVLGIMALVFIVTTVLLLKQWEFISGQLSEFLMLISLQAIIYPFQTVTQARAERDLNFKDIAVVEVIQGIFYQAIVITIAWKYQSPVCFVIGFLGKGAVGALLINLKVPWKMRINFNWAIVKSKLKLGLFFQGSTFLNIVRDSFVPIVTGYLLGKTAVGFISWAGMLSIYPIIILNIFNRIYLPWFSRIQSDKAALKQVLERIIIWANRVTAPLITILIFFGGEVIQLVFTDKWMPAYFLLISLSISNIIVPTSMPCFSFLNALGYSNTTFKLTVFWTILLWAVGSICIPQMGFDGYGVTILIVNSFSVLLFIKVKKIINIKFISLVFPTWTISLLGGILVLIINFKIPVLSIPDLILRITGFVLFVIAGHWIVFKRELKSDFEIFKKLMTSD